MVRRRDYDRDFDRERLDPDPRALRRSDDGEITLRGRVLPMGA
jgi:hypothetical protein